MKQLITGGASGMGRAQAKLFAKEGAKVIATDINKKGLKETIKQIRNNGGEAIDIVFDVSDTSQIEHVIKQAHEAYGPIDILINTAGILDNFKNALDLDEETFDKVIGINLRGVHFLTKAVLPDMLEKEHGSIVNIASIAGLMGNGGRTAYTISKHGLIGYTRHLAYTYSSKGVKINAIAPGAIHSGMTEELFKDKAMLDMVESKPIGRYGTSEEIAEATLFLASDEARFITGAILPVDGRWILQ